MSGRSRQAAAPALFISPMGEPFRPDDRGARGIDLWFAEADADYDHRISQTEFLANADAFFTTLDANHDGVATSIESTALWRRLAPEVVSGDEQTPPPQAQNGDEEGRFAHNEADELQRGRERPQGAQSYGLLGDAEPVMSCDANLDQRVTRAEFAACAARRFTELDADHDGQFTIDEAAQRMGGGRRSDIELLR